MNEIWKTYIPEHFSFSFGNISFLQKKTNKIHFELTLTRMDGVSISEIDDLINLNIHFIDKSSLIKKLHHFNYSTD